jgi:demethylmenaquinone methyltransferase / 2-methoxy-6-polyprenyl-1,4-benzoquinol methylase
MSGTSRDTLISPRENRRMFDLVARHYDRMNALMSFGLHRSWRRRAVNSLLSRDGRFFLDVGCGTGDVALEAVAQSVAARVIGIDPSRDMLAIAAAKTRQAGAAGRVHFQVADACALPFFDRSFDGIVSAFCIRNVVDRAAAFREMHRVLRPGGNLAILELTPPQHPLFGVVHAIHTRRLIPLLGRLASHGDAYRYLADSIDHFPPASVIEQELLAAGFCGVSLEALSGGFVTLFNGERASGSVKFL